MTSIVDDPQVQAAIQHPGRNARLLAGPGTGKTFCLTQRIATLVLDHGVRPSEIMAVTFTRAAAREMRARLVALGLGEDQIPKTSTLHSFALSVLMTQKPYADLPHPLHVADDYEESEIVFPELAAELRWGMPFLRETRLAYEDAWSTLEIESEDWRKKNLQPAFEHALENLQQFYGFTLRGQLLYLLKRLLDGHPVFIQELGLQHVLVDEYQDLNRCDQAVLKSLVTGDASIYAAGDDDQSIYSFRHAHISGIRNFDAQYPGFADLPLTTCQRCPKQVIEIATSLIKFQEGRIDKALAPRDDAPLGNVHCLEFEDDQEEASGIAELCRREISSGTETSEILILLSRRRLGRAISSSLSDLGIPYQSFLRSDSPLDESGGRLAYTLLRLVASPNDPMLWRTWLGCTPRIGFKSCIQIRQFCLGREMSLAQGISLLADSPSELSRIGSIVAEAYPESRAAIAAAVDMEDLRTQVDCIIDFVRGRGIDVTQFQHLVEQAIEQAQATTLQELLSTLGDPDLESALMQGKSGVKLMTMWGAKGLAADVTINPALENDLLPDGGTEDEIEERRRLLYVSVTRARRSLYMTHAARRSGAGSWMGSGLGSVRKRRSRFLDHLDVKSEPATLFLSSEE